MEEDGKLTKEEVKNLYHNISKDRYKNWSGYKLDRWIIQAFMFLTLGYLFFVAYHYNFNLDYYKCEGTNTGQTFIDSCENPFYKEVNAWKGQEYLAPGEYGFKPTLLFKSIYNAPVFLMLLAFFINHLVYNRKFKFKKTNEVKL